MIHWVSSREPEPCTSAVTWFPVVHARIRLTGFPRSTDGRNHLSTAASAGLTNSTLFHRDVPRTRSTSPVSACAVVLERRPALNGAATRGGRPPPRGLLAGDSPQIPHKSASFRVPSPMPSTISGTTRRPHFSGLRPTHGYRRVQAHRTPRTQNPMPVILAHPSRRREHLPPRKTPPT